jgi:hypothetical protein
MPQRGQMIDKQKIESQIAGPLSAALITVATISLTLMGIVLQRDPAADWTLHMGRSEFG